MSMLVGEQLNVAVCSNVATQQLIFELNKKEARTNSNNHPLTVTPQEIIYVRKVRRV